MKKIVLILLSLLTFGYAEFINDESNSTVIDTDTGLMWQNDYRDNGNSVKVATWQEAIEYCEGLEITLGDQLLTDWRLPNINELLSIVVRDNNESPFIDEAFSNGDSSNFYWSSTTYVQTKTQAWSLSFADTLLNGIKNKTESLHVGCVRNAQALE